MDIYQIKSKSKSLEEHIVRYNRIESSILRILQIQESQ